MGAASGCPGRGWWRCERERQGSTTIAACGEALHVNWTGYDNVEGTARSAVSLLHVGAAQHRVIRRNSVCCALFPGPLDRHGAGIRLVGGSAEQVDPVGFSDDVGGPAECIDVGAERGQC